jgi:hypothetical protein
MAKKKRLTWKERQLAVAKRWAEIMGIDPVTLQPIKRKAGLVRERCFERCSELQDRLE